MMHFLVLAAMMAAAAPAPGRMRWRPRWERENGLRRPADGGGAWAESVCRSGRPISRVSNPSPPQLRHLFEPPQLARVADSVDAGDPAVLDREGDRRVEPAGEIDPAGKRAVQPHGADCRARR